MKKIIVIFFLVPIFDVVAVDASTNYVLRTALALQQKDKKTEISANLRQAKYMMENNNYSGAKKKLDRVLELDPSNVEANNLIAECKIKVDQIRKIEKTEFQDACKKNTISALRMFVDEHPNSELRKDAEDRIKDFELWYTAKDKNTIESYNSYIQNSTIKAYIIDAQTAIKKIQEEQSWNTCKDSENEDLLSDFVGNYPESPYINEANFRLNILKGQRMYNDGFAETAYLYLNSANSYRPLTGKEAVLYAELKEKNTFKEIQASSDVDIVRKYLNTLSISSPYYNDTSNHLALLLGAKLSAWSPESSMNEALSFAKDESTKSIVKRYINQAKDLHRSYERQRKASARKAWWKRNFKIGIDADIETNIDSESGSAMFYSVGLAARFGNYTSNFSVVTGVKYRWLRMEPKYRASYYDEYYDAYNNDYYGHYNYYDYGSNKRQSYGGAISIPLSIRYQFFRITTRSKLFIGAGGEFGVGMFESSDKKDCLENNYISLFPQFGLTCPNFEMSLYWKSYVNGPFKKSISNMYSEFGCSSLIGFQMAVFF